MLNDNSGLVKLILSILLFPTFFQETFIKFAWGVGDPLWVAMSKRLFLLLPVAAIILGCWLTVACVLTIIIRPNRHEYVKSIFITWWDMGKAIASFWGGIFKFVFTLFVTTIEFIKVAILAVWALVQELILMPFRLLGNMGRNVVSSQVPWIAVVLTLFWCFIEAVIFTYVTTPLVVDTFSNITGDTLTENIVRIPLFIFLLFVVLGSYAVLSTFVSSLQKKNIGEILGIGVIEITVLFVEVIFLYREFVDALVPWFAQYSENFELGIFGTLAISTFVWFGIRSLSWFLFASHGTPTIMTVIQGKGMALAERGERPAQNYSSISTTFMEKIKADIAWVQQAGDDLIAAFIIPPLQIIAAALNFCMLLLNGQFLFKLPFAKMEDLKIISSKEEIIEETQIQEQPTRTNNIEQPKPNFGEFQNVKAQ